MAEESATQLSKERNPQGMQETAETAVDGASVARTARDDFERRLGHSVITSERAIEHTAPADQLPFNDKDNPDDVEYDFYSEEPYYQDGDASWQYHIGHSATGIYAEWVRESQTLFIELPCWASRGDVELYASVINSLLSKHPRAKLYDGDARLEQITEGMQKTMLSERRRYLKKKLQTKEHFTMEGLITEYDIDVAFERQSGLTEDEIIDRLQREFVAVQWED